MSKWMNQYIETVMPFMIKAKSRMKKLKKDHVRIKCSDHELNYVHVRLVGRKQHIHAACEIADCKYRIME